MLNNRLIDSYLQRQEKLIEIAIDMSHEAKGLLLELEFNGTKLEKEEIAKKLLETCDKFRNLILSREGI